MAAPIHLFRNNSRSVLASSISSSTTSITLVNGSSFPTITNTDTQSFVATISDGSFEEIIRVHSRVGNILGLCERGEEGTTPRSFTAGAKVEHRLTAADLNLFIREDDIPDLDFVTSSELAAFQYITPTQLNARNYIDSTELAGFNYVDSGELAAFQYVTPAQLQAAITPPINSIELRYDALNPVFRYPGTTWSMISQGRMLIGQNSGDTDFDLIGETGGAKTVTLTEDQMPAHTHDFTFYDPDDTSPVRPAGTGLGAGPSVVNSTTIAGGGQAHNNMPPYLVVSIWRRTA